MDDNRFYVDDVPLARNMSEWPPEIYFKEPRKEMPKRKYQTSKELNTGQIIHDMRIKAGLSQEALAKRIGGSRSRVGVDESRASCTVKTLADYADAMGFEIIIRRKKDQ